MSDESIFGLTPGGGSKKKDEPTGEDSKKQAPQKGRGRKPRAPKADAPTDKDTAQAPQAREGAPAKAQDAEGQDKPAKPARRPRKRGPRKPRRKPEAAPQAASEEIPQDATPSTEAAPQPPAEAPQQADAPKAAQPQTQAPTPKPPVAEKPAPAPKAAPTIATADDVEVVEPEDAMQEITMADLPEHLQQACIRAKWDGLMPVQALSIPYLLAGRDLMIQSRTGSGKTGAFTLPVMDRIDLSRNQTQALVLVPTRELAQQVAREAETLFGDTGARVVAVYGGTGYGPQLDAFKQGAHLVVGTPGRVLDHLMRGSLSLEGLKALIFDEADRMLSIGFYPDMKAVQRYLPKRKVGMFMTSATYPPHVMRLAGEFMDKPQLLSLSRKMVHVAETPHAFYEVNAMDKDRALVRLIEMENPNSAFIFCNTKHHVHYVTAVLQRFGYDADELSGDLTQNKREEVLRRVRAGELRYLVSTDVAARGIDIPDLSHVFLYEPPEDHESYIHRAGRTGRAGASGEVISLVDVMEKLALKKIAKTYKIELEHRQLPTDEDVQSMVAQRVTALLEKRPRDCDNIVRERMSRFKPLVKSLGENEDLTGLMAMLLDEYYQESLHSKDQGPKGKPSRRGDKGRDGRGERSGQNGRRSSGNNNRRSTRNAPKPAGDAPATNNAPRDADTPKKEDKPDGDKPKPRSRRRRRRRKPSGGERRSEGGRTPREDAPGGGSTPADGEKSSQGRRPPREGRPPRDGRPSGRRRPSGGSKPPSGDKTQQTNRPPRGNGNSTPKPETDRSGNRPDPLPGDGKPENFGNK